VRFALHNRLIEKSDVIYVRNQLLDFLGVKEPVDNPDELLNGVELPEYATPILEKVLDYCFEKGILAENTLTHRDLLDTRIMGFFMSKPSEVISKFQDIKNRDGITAATDYFYHLCRKSDYIRMERIAKNLKWDYESPFGNLEITINLTKPEKDPKEIAALKNAPQSGYPKCLLCPDNVGYAGRVNHPARQTHRTIPLDLHGETWHFQYSPYVYYNEHCIVLKEKHVPMKLTRETFIRLFRFIDLFPHYFIGSNADLPIVGGSILNHDHFQGGRYVFPMEKAEAEYALACSEYPDVEAAVVHWPMSVLRLSSKDPEKLVNLAVQILSAWREYSDPDHEILAYSIDENGNSVPHNTITPIARKKEDGRYELDLVLRNNRTSAEHPLGIFHPHKELHHIKKENIGLIEVMGLFILPGRLQKELGSLEAFLTGEAKDSVQALDDPGHPLNHHSTWMKDLVEQNGTNLTGQEAKSVLEKAVGAVCQQVLTDAGVFKVTAKGRQGFDKFLKTVGLARK
jgi:UDPglucose--hexose-1-phosphate uridylyltransferase